MNTNISTNIEALISSFAKSKKIGKAQLTDFVQAVIEQLPKAPVSACKAGRKTTDEAIRVRESLCNMHTSLKGNSFLVKNVAQKINTDVSTLNSQLNWLASHEGMFAKAGIAESKGRGRKSIVWVGV